MSWLLWKRRLKTNYNRIFRRADWEAHLKELHYTPDETNMLWEFPGVALFAAEIGSLFVKSGASNYVEFALSDHPSMTTYVVTIRKRSGLAPGEIVSQFRTALEAIQADPANAASIADAALRKVGYKDAQ